MIKPKILYNPATIAECGGPCEQGPEYCDCGELRIDPPTPTELSPAAKAVFDAYIAGLASKRRNAIAAALRAAVDQVIPLIKTRWGTTLIPVLTAQKSRDHLLAIADELEKTMCPQQQEDN